MVDAPRIEEQHSSTENVHRQVPSKRDNLKQSDHHQQGWRFLVGKVGIQWFKLMVTQPLLHKGVDSERRKRTRREGEAVDLCYTRGLLAAFWPAQHTASAAAWVYMGFNAAFAPTYIVVHGPVSVPYMCSI